VSLAELGRIKYPELSRGDVSDFYQTKTGQINVSDPYRFLEEPDSP